MAEKKDENSGKGKDQVPHSKDSFPKFDKHRVTVTLTEKKQTHEYEESQAFVEGLIAYNMDFKGYDNLMEVKFNGSPITREFIMENEPMKAFLADMEEKGLLTGAGEESSPTHARTQEPLDGDDGSEVFKWIEHPENYKMVKITTKRYTHGVHVIWTKNLDYLRGVYTFANLGLVVSNRPAESQTPLELFNRLVAKVEIGGVLIEN